MNFLRLTQRPVQDEIYKWCDRLGLMTQTDLPLFAKMRRFKFAEGVRQAQELARMIRGHACNVVVSYMNEPTPGAGGKPHRHLTRPEMEDFLRPRTQTLPSRLRYKICRRRLRSALRLASG